MVMVRPAPLSELSWSTEDEVVLSQPCLLCGFIVLHSLPLGSSEPYCVWIESSLGITVSDQDVFFSAKFLAHKLGVASQVHSYG